MSSPLAYSCSSCGNFLTNKLYKTYPSPSTEMLNSNTVYSSAQTREFSTTVADMEADITRFDGEMFRLQETMDHLRNERQKLANSLDDYRFLAAPIRRIPPEILSEIFLHCLVDDSEIFDVAEAPLLLSFVCNRWRTVAISTPRLWSFVRVKSGGFISMEMLQTWLFRSCNSPLTLAIDAEYFEDDVVRSCIDALIPHCRRWQDVEFILPGQLLSMFSAVAGSLPLLQKVHIDTMQQITMPSLDAFEVAPMLCDATLTCNPYICLPWRQLKQYTLHYFSTPDYLYVLQRSPNLVHCRIDCIGDENSISHLPDTPMLRPHLRSLELIVTTRMDLANILDNIAAPALDELEITQMASFSHAIWTQDRLSRFLTRSCCKIRCLRLRDITMTAGELIVCLQALPLLAELEVTGIWEIGMLPSIAVTSAITSEMLDQLTHRKSGQTLSLPVPKLKHLTLSNCFHFEDRALLEMVQSRWGLTNLEGNASTDGSVQRVESLESVHLEFHRVVLPETIAQMALWRDEGLELEVYIFSTRVV